jgi:hypothetical protein
MDITPPNTGYPRQPYPGSGSGMSWRGHTPPAIGLTRGRGAGRGRSLSRGTQPGGGLDRLASHSQQQQARQQVQVEPRRPIQKTLFTHPADGQQTNGVRNNPSAGYISPSRPEPESGSGDMLQPAGAFDFSPPKRGTTSKHIR